MDALSAGSPWCTPSRLGGGALDYVLTQVGDGGFKRRSDPINDHEGGIPASTLNLTTKRDRDPGPVRQVLLSQPELLAGEQNPISQFR